MKLIPKYVAGTKAAMDIASTVLILGLVGAMSLYIFIKMIQGAREEITVKKGKA